jgi:hypothetical protein
MKQQECLPPQSAMNDFASLPGTEDTPDGPSQHWPLSFDVQLVDFLSNYTIRGVLESFTPGEVSILLDEPVSEQRTVFVHINSFVFEGHTLYCQPQQDRYETHVSINDVDGSGIRRTPRFPVNLPARLFLSDANPVAIRILDISRDGLGIESPVPVDAGQAIAVECGPVFVFAVVRHQRQLSDGLFRAGAEMHHLFEMNVDLPADAPRLTLLQRIRGKRSEKAGTCNPRLTPRLL